MSSIDDALKAAEKTSHAKTFEREDNKERMTSRFGVGQPPKDEKDKARNKIVLYFTDEEIDEIAQVAELNGFSAKDKNKYVKAALKKMVRVEKRNLGL